jgi:hypothetical protein
MAYKSMNPIIYYSVTIALYILEIYLSIIISDISDIFGFIGTIAGTSLSFFMPSIMFNIAYKKASIEF